MRRSPVRLVHLAATVVSAGLIAAGGQVFAQPASTARLAPSVEQTSGTTANETTKKTARSKAVARRAASRVQRSQVEAKRLSLIQQRKRAALQQRLLLQEQGLRENTTQSQRQLDRIRDQQAESLRLQQDQQRRTSYQQRRLAIPQAPGAVPRLTPGLDRPLIEQRNPSCGVAGMPLC